MQTLLTILAHHAYLALALFCFLEAVGLPVPAALAILAAGAACAWHQLRIDAALITAVVAMIAGDLLLFLLGRFTGWGLLGVLCRLAANPESCILRSADSFYKRGRATLVVAKFIPAINTMAPPLAGSMMMPAGQFLALDAAGALLYVGAFGTAGYFFSGMIGAIATGFHSASRAIGWLMVLAVLAYIVYHLVLYWKHRVYRVVPRVQVHELAQRLADPEQAARIMIADVRSHGYYDAGAARIHGSTRLEPNMISIAIKELPKDKEIYLYCT